MAPLVAIHSALQTRPCRSSNKPFSCRKRSLGRRHTAARIAYQYTLKTPSSSVTVDQDAFTIGSSSKCDLQDTTAKVFPEHAQIVRKGKQLFCRALDKEGESILDSKTYTWVDDIMIRQGPSYLLSSGTKISIGTETNTYIIEFEESSGRNPMMEMMLKGMASTANQDVKKVIDDFLKEK